MSNPLSHKYPIPISQLCLVNTDVPAGVGAPPLDTTSSRYLEWSIAFYVIMHSSVKIFPGVTKVTHTHTHTNTTQFGEWHRFGGIHCHWLWKEVHEICQPVSWWISSTRISTSVLQVSGCNVCMCTVVSGAYVCVYSDGTGGVSIHFVLHIYIMCSPPVTPGCSTNQQPLVRLDSYGSLNMAGLNSFIAAPMHL